MPVQQGRNGERSQKKEQMSRRRLSLILQQVEKEGLRMRPLTCCCLTCFSRCPEMFPHSSGAHE